MSTKTLPLLLCFCLLIISGCQESEKAVPQPQIPLTPQPVVRQPNIVSKIYTCQACPVVQLDTMMPAQVQAGTEFEYTIKVTNLTDEVLTDVIVTDVSASNFQPVRSTPPPAIEQDKIKWIFPQIGPRQTMQIDGIAVASSGGEVINYIDVAYTTPVRLRTISLQPKIIISKSAPAEISACAPILYIFKVENVGTGPANNLRLYDTLPQGLTTTDGNSSIDIPIGTLGVGASRTISVALTASRTGIYVNNAVAIADGEITAESGEVTTTVRKPVLSITSTAPQTDYVNMELTYDIAVTNTGDWPAVDTVIENAVPQGMRFVRGSQGVNFTDNKVLWKVVRINPGDTVNTSVTFIPSVVGPIENTFRASAVCADVVAATAKTEIKGAAGILLEVGDTADPVRIGNTTTYRIVATNQGTVPVTNILIKAALENSMTHVSNAGATKGQLSEGTITFEPLTWLAPRTQAIWEITVNAATEGDVRFKAEMTADQLDSPVMETESTHFYE